MHWEDFRGLHNSNIKDIFNMAMYSWLRGIQDLTWFQNRSKIWLPRIKAKNCLCSIKLLVFNLFNFRYHYIYIITCKWPAIDLGISLMPLPGEV